MAWPPYTRDFLDGSQAPVASTGPRDFQSALCRDRGWSFPTQNIVSSFEYGFGFGASISGTGYIFDVQDYELLWNPTYATNPGQPLYDSGYLAASGAGGNAGPPNIVTTNYIISGVGGLPYGPRLSSLGGSDMSIAYNRTYLNSAQYFVGPFFHSGATGSTQWLDLIESGTYSLSITTSGGGSGFSTSASGSIAIYATQGATQILLFSVSSGGSWSPGLTATFSSTAAFGNSGFWSILVVQSGCSGDFSSFSWTLSGPVYPPCVDFATYSPMTIASGTGIPTGYDWGDQLIQDCTSGDWLEAFPWSVGGGYVQPVCGGFISGTRTGP